MIEIKDLTFTIDEELIIDDLSLSIKQHEQIAIVGPSGCGKTTLLKLLLNLLKPSSGEIENKFTDFGYMPQKDLLLPWLTIGENIALPKDIIGSEMSNDEIRKVLKKFKVEAKLTMYPHELSGGMQSRINLIRALMMSDQLIFLDEPFAKLDYLTHLSITNWFKQICQQKKLTSVLVTHNIDEAIELADRIVVLSAKPATIISEYIVNDYQVQDLKQQIITALK